MLRKVVEHKGDEYSKAMREKEWEDDQETGKAVVLKWGGGKLTENGDWNPMERKLLREKTFRNLAFLLSGTYINKNTSNECIIS